MQLCRDPDINTANFITRPNTEENSILDSKTANLIPLN